MILGAAAAGLAGTAAIGQSRWVTAQETDVPAGGTLWLDLAANVNLSATGSGPARAFYLQSTVYDGLVITSADWNTVEPALAETWEVSEDGVTFTFALRQGVSWHDGTPFTSADVAFTYQTLLTQAVTSAWIGDLLNIKGAQAFFEGTADSVEGITVIDDHTISLTLAAPNAAFIGNALTFHSMIPAHIWQEVPAEEIAKPETWEQTQIGTGPFKFSTYEIDRFVELVRNDDSWRGQPHLDRVMFQRVGTTPDAIAAALESGELDFARVPQSEMERLGELEHLNVSSKPIYNLRALAINTAKPYLADKRVRQAFAYGIDRSTMCTAVLGGLCDPANSLSVSETWRNDDLPAYAYDPEMAKSLLAEAGWDPDQEIELGVYYQDQQSLDYMATMQQQLANIGVKSVLTTIEAVAVQSYYYENREFDVLYIGYGISPDMDAFRIVLSSDAMYPNGNNATSYSNPRVDELFVAGAATSDFEERKAIYDELQAILADELPWIPLHFLHIAGGFNVRVINGDAIFNQWTRPYNWNIEQVAVSDGV